MTTAKRVLTLHGWKRPGRRKVSEFRKLLNAHPLANPKVALTLTETERAQLGWLARGGREDAEAILNRLADGNEYPSLTAEARRVLADAAKAT